MIYARYIGEGNYHDTGFGRFLVFQSIENEKHFFILGHLSETPGCVITFRDNEEITPGTIVGYVGNTGNCSDCNTQADRDKGNGSHLHVQLVVREDEKQIIYNINKQTLGELNKYSINPFDYNDKYAETKFREDK